MRGVFIVLLLLAAVAIAAINETNETTNHAPNKTMSLTKLVHHNVITHVPVQEEAIHWEITMRKLPTEPPEKKTSFTKTALKIIWLAILLAVGIIMIAFLANLAFAFLELLNQREAELQEEIIPTVVVHLNHRYGGCVDGETH